MVGARLCSRCNRPESPDLGIYDVVHADGSCEQICGPCYHGDRDAYRGAE